MSKLNAWHHIEVELNQDEMDLMAAIVSIIGISTKYRVETHEEGGNAPYNVVHIQVD